MRHEAAAHHSCPPTPELSPHFRWTEHLVDRHLDATRGDELGGPSFDRLSPPVGRRELHGPGFPRVLTGAYMPTLRFHWDEIGGPVLASEEDLEARGHDDRMPVLAQFLRRLEDLGMAEESQDGADRPSDEKSSSVA